jgi:hypothetical protein
MKIKPKIIFLIFTFALFFATSPAFAEIVYENFEADDSYNTGGGWAVGCTLDLAFTFSTPSVDHYFTSVEMAVSLPQSNPASDLYVWILTDTSNSPGAVIGSLYYDGPIPAHNNPGIIELISSTHFVLEADSIYWIAAGRTPAWYPETALANIVWHHPLYDSGAIYYREPEEEWDFFGPNYYKGAFRINGIEKYQGDFDSDGDVDGGDLAELIEYGRLSTGVFAENFGSAIP